MLPRLLVFSPFFIVKQALKNLLNFYDFTNTQPIVFIAFYCKIRHVRAYGILARPVTYIL